MYRKYYSYNDMPVPANANSSDNRNEPSVKNEPDGIVKSGDESIPAAVEVSAKPYENGRLFGKFENDDILLLVVIFILLADGCDDDLLIIALAVVFLLGK